MYLDGAPRGDRMTTMNPIKVLAAAGALALVFSVASSAQGPKRAPDFAGKTADGKAVSLRSLTAKGPVFLYFIKADCPINAKAMPYFKRMYAAYGTAKVPLLGVIDAEGKTYQEWQDQFKAPFPILLDPAKKTIGAYGAERSPWVIEVKRDGTLGRTWAGYSQLALKELNKALALAKGRKAVAIDTTGAPARLAYG